MASDRLVMVAHEAGHYVSARLGNVVTFYWMKSNSLPAIDALVQLCEQVSAARTRSFSAVQIVRPNIGLPDAPARRALATAMKKFADVSSCLAIVTPGAGFWVSALQGAITGMRMLAPTGGSMLRFIAKPEDLRGWFSDEHMARTGESLDEERVIAAVTQVLAIGDGQLLGAAH